MIFNKVLFASKLVLEKTVQKFNIYLFKISEIFVLFNQGLYIHGIDGVYAIEISGIGV